MPQKAKASTRRAANDSQIRWLHYLRLYCFALLIAVLFGIHFAAQAQIATTKKQQSVLAYATGISVSDLLASTNQVRAANGLGPLTLNAKLNSGAQAKANDMIAKNYWAHNAPDGTQPWAFFISAGYTYTSAGENLAYGFDTSGQVVNGWMNSPEHRANVLGNYADVGFGFASGPNYQGGPNTVVVGFYGVPHITAPPAASATVKQPPAPVQKPATPTPAQTTPQPAPTPQPQAPTTQITSNTTSQPKKITVPNTNWAMYASFGALGITTAASQPHIGKLCGATGSRVVATPFYIRRLIWQCSLRLQQRPLLLLAL